MEKKGVTGWVLRERKDLRKGHEGEYRTYYVKYENNKEITKRLVNNKKVVKRGQEPKSDGWHIVIRKDQRTDERRKYRILYKDGKEIQKHVFEKKKTRKKKKKTKKVVKKSKKSKKTQKSKKK